MRRLLIRLPERCDASAEPQVEFLLAEDDRPGVTQRGTLAEAAAYGAGGRVLVLVPGAEVLLTQAALPVRQRQRLLKAVPYALEEQLAADVEGLHFALGQAQDGGFAVAVVERVRIEHWLGLLRAAGLEPHALVPDTLALPLGERAWWLLREGDTVLLRRGAQSGLAIDLDNAAEILTLTLAEAATVPEMLHLLDCGPQRHDWSALAEVCTRAGATLLAEPGAEPALPGMARQLGAAGMFNLLQGEYSRDEQLGRLWRPWRAAAALLALWLVGHGALLATEYSRLDARDQALREQMVELYRETFPDARNIPDPRAQLEHQLTQLRQGGAKGEVRLLELLAALGGATQPADALSLRGLRYRDGRLDVDFEIVDLQALDRFKQRLAAQPGLAVEILAANARGSTVEARIQLGTGS